MLNITQQPSGKFFYKCLGPVCLITIEDRDLGTRHYLSDDISNPDTKIAGFLIVRYSEYYNYNIKKSQVEQIFLIDKDYDIYWCATCGAYRGVPEFELGQGVVARALFIGHTTGTHRLENWEVNGIKQAAKNWNLNA